MKSPVASLCFDCSSVRNLVRVTISVLISASCAVTPVVAMLEICVRLELGLKLGMELVDSWRGRKRNEGVFQSGTVLCPTVTSGRCGVASGRKVYT